MKNLKQFTLVSALIAAASLGAQETVGSVVGTVRDASGAAVAGALVRISGPNLLQPRETTTDANGRYSFRLILPGQARVQATKQGLIGSAQTFNVQSGSTLTVDLTMRPMSVATEEVEVLGGKDNPTIDKTETKVSSTFTANDLFNLPMGGTGVYGALYLAPGVSGSTGFARIRGGTAGQTMYSINGIQTRDAEVGQGRQYEFLLDDMIQDVQVVQNPINAKYGFTSTGSVNVTTKTGTNRFEGSFRVVADNDAWTSINGTGSGTRFGQGPEAMPWNDLMWGAWGYDPPDARGDNQVPEYQVTLSGPIWKDRITFIYGGRFQPQGYGTVNHLNVLGNNPDNYRTYIPGFKNGDARLQGPHPVTGVLGDQWAGPIWAANPLAPTAAIRGVIPSNFEFNQYKLFFQITPNHQADILYSKDSYTSYGANSFTTPDTSIVFPNTADRILKGVSYRGIYGANAVLSAQWSVGGTNVTFPQGPDDTIFYQTWQLASRSILAAGNGTGQTQYATGGAYSYSALREVENWSVDLNYIWDAHNIDAGVQRINERSTRNGYGIRNRAFWTPAMRYDGTYMVWNPFAADSPLREEVYNPSTADLTYYGYSTGTNPAALWRAGILSGTRVPYFRQYVDPETETPHDSQITSVYLNDNWTYSDKFAVNVGLRLDQNIVSEQRGEMVNAMSFSPRLRLQYDLNGDNRHVFAFSFTQASGSLYRAAMGEFAANNVSAASRRYIWNTGSGQPHFVDKEEFKKTTNYGHYYSYTNSTMYSLVDKDLKPEQTTNFELQYRRAFSQGGYFRASLIYNLLTTALFGEMREDEEIELKDPTGTVPDAGRPFIDAANTYAWKRYLYNRADRGRHYAGLEMEWMMPLVTKPTYRLNWAGNWTIAKTTGNYIFGATGNSTDTTAGSSVQYYDQLVNVGMPRNMVDPWGESSATPRHRARTWLTLSHGERGGIINELTLFANWTDGTFTDTSWEYVLPTTTFKFNAQGGQGGHVQNMTTAGSSDALYGYLYPYGRANWRGNASTYTATLTWNVTIPIKGTLAAFVNLMIMNPFNTVADSFGYSTWSGGNNGARRTWTRDQNPSDDPLFGKYVASNGNMYYYGIYAGSVTGRDFNNGNSTLQFGFRF